jgi:hypothetical protein
LQAGIDQLLGGESWSGILKVYRLIEKVWVVHSKPQNNAQRAIIASVSHAALQSHRNSLKSYEVEFLIDHQEISNESLDQATASARHRTAACLT